MPIPPPDPIRFDDAAADDAIAELLLTAESLFAMVALLESQLEDTTEDWRGQARTVFDLESARHDLTARALAESLGLVATSVASLRFEKEAAEARAWATYQADLDATAEQRRASVGAQQPR